MGMTVDEVKAYVVRKLGGGIEDVELTPEHLDDIIADTNRWFAFRAGQKTVVKLDGQSDKTHYQLPDFVIEVLNVRTVQRGVESASLGTDDFSYAYSFLFGSWYTNSQYGGMSQGYNYSLSPYPYSDLVQRLQFLETIGRIFGGDPEWDYQKETRTLIIAPSATIGGTVAGGASQESAILVEVFTRNIDTRILDPEAEDFYLRWAVAEGKETLGDIRRKYDSYPTVGGDRGLNGEALVADAREAKEKLDRQVLDRMRSTPIITG